MNTNDFIKENYSNLLQSAKNISKGHELSQESLHYAIEEFLGKPNVQEIVDSGGGTYYIVSILLKCWRSNTSPFYRRYLQPPEEIPDIPEEIIEDNVDELYKKATALLNGLHWYDKKLFETWLEEKHTISSLSRATGIPRTSISLTLRRVRAYLQQELRKTM